MVKGVIFDLDGTLLDSMWVWHEVDTRFLKNHGLPVEDAYLQALKSMNFRQCAAYTRAYYHVELTDAEMMAEWDALARQAYAEEVRPKAGVPEFLAYLAERKIPMSVATSCYETLFRPALTRCGLYDYFTAFTTKDEVPKSKEHPDIYLRAAEKIGCAPEQCAAFEDILLGVRTLRGAGFYTVAVAEEYSLHQRDTLCETSHLYIEDFTDPRIYTLF